MTPQIQARGTRLRAHATGLTLGCIAVLLAGGCSSDGSDAEPYNRDFAATECHLSSSLEAVLGDGSSLSYATARAWKTDGVYHFQLLPTGAAKEAAGGSVEGWSTPPAGALTLSLNTNSPENSTFQIDPQPTTSPTQVPIDQIFLSLAAPNLEIGATGQVSVVRNIFHLLGDYANLDVILTDIALTDGGRLTGSASIECGDPVQP